MILSKKDLADYIAADTGHIKNVGAKEHIIAVFARYPYVDIKKYMCFLRKQEYYINTANKSRIRGLLGIVCERRKNRLGNRMGIEISPNCCGRGLRIWHANIVINYNAVIGENCTLHGANCIGYNGLTEDAPVIGNNVDIGYGAVIIGGIQIAEDIKIGANAVVNRSFTEPGVTIAGVPAKVIKQRNDK